MVNYNCRSTSATNADYAVRNALFWNVQTNFNGSASSAHVEHLTTDGAIWLNYNQTLAMTNCLLVAVTNYGTYASDTVFTASDPTTVFQKMRAGQHYLPPISPYRGTANTTITPSLLASLRKMTTDAPLLLSGTYNSAMTLAPVTTVDSGPGLNVGYHYEKLDYCGGAYFNNNLILTNGVAVGIMSGGFNTFSNVFCSGTAAALNRFACYANVFEQPSNWNGSVGLTMNSSTARFRFTDFAIPAAVQAGTSTNVWLAEVSFRDCQIRGANVDLEQVSQYGFAAFTNNVLERSLVYVSTNSYFINYGGAFYIYNNLFKGSFLNLVPRYSVTIQNNLFDGVSPCVYTNYTFYRQINYNAFTTNTTCTLEGSANISNLVADYQAGPLGKYYYPASGTGLATLKDAGSCNATNLGLYHYTTCINLAKETNSIVDTGYHYVATDAQGNPLDTDGDGLPDYLEDSNGDGIGSNDAFDWQNRSTTGDGTSDYTDWIQGRNPRTGIVPDTGNQINMRLYTPLK